MIKYRWDIDALGYSADNDNIILCRCWVYKNDGTKLFMGIWGYDLARNQALLYSINMLLVPSNNVVIIFFISTSCLS